MHTSTLTLRILLKHRILRILLKLRILRILRILLRLAVVRHCWSVQWHFRL
jgi:hypothetical protein